MAHPFRVEEHPRYRLVGFGRTAAAKSALAVQGAMREELFARACVRPPYRRAPIYAFNEPDPRTGRWRLWTGIPRDDADADDGDGGGDAPEGFAHFELAGGRYARAWVAYPELLPTTFQSLYCARHGADGEYAAQTGRPCFERWTPEPEGGFRIDCFVPLVRAPRRADWCLAVC